MMFLAYSNLGPGLHPSPAMELEWRGWFTIGILLIAFYTMIKEIRPPDVVMCFAAGVLTVIGAITPKQLLQGLSSDVLITIALLCIVVRTLEVNGILNLLTRHILPTTENPSKRMFSVLTPVAALSAFLNNTVIVLMMTPILRNWALKIKLAPSQFLIPLSYASIVGGLCTLIGTSTNVIIDGLLRQQNPSAGLTFFELSKVGLPIVFVVVGFVSIVGRRLLPDRQDVTSKISQQTKDFTAEFIVEEECPLIGKVINETGRHFQKELLVEIERDGRMIASPGPYEVILIGDRLIFAGDINQIAEIHTIKGLTSAADPHFELDESSSHFSEVVVSLTSSLIGKTVKSTHFRERYGASVLAIYRNGSRIKGNVGRTILDTGDTLILLTGELWESSQYTSDFYTIRYQEKLTIFQPMRALLVLSGALGMVLLAGMGMPIMLAVLAAALFFIFTRSIPLREVQSSILWNVLLLIASSFAVANAVKNTGVATLFAEMLLTVLGDNPYVLVGGIVLVASIFTEMLSNNAAALLLFPVALQTVQLAGYESLEALKTVGVAVAVGSSCGFALPTGYQTHMIVYGPGGYRLADFLRMGIFIDLIIIVTAAFLIPYFWPLY